MRLRATTPRLLICVTIDLGSTFELLGGDEHTAIGLNSLLLALNPFNWNAYLQRGKAYGPHRQTRQAIEDYSLA